MSDDNTTTKTTVADDAKTTATETGQTIYLGPQILQKGLLSGQVFIGGVPEHIKEYIANKPLMSQLFVPVSQIVAAQQAVNTPGTPQYIAYHNALGGK